MFNLKQEKLFEYIHPNQENFSNIFLYKSSPSDDRWVVKHKHVLDIEKLLNYLQAIFLNSNHNHPSILSVRGFYVESAQPRGYNIYTKLPRMKESLKDIVNRSIDCSTLFPEELIIKYFYNLISGLEYLHNRKIPHKNIKPTNILADKHGNLKLADIGTKEEAYGLTFNISIDEANSLYTAPEMKTREEPGSLSKTKYCCADIWSLGAIIAELCLLEPGIQGKYGLDNGQTFVEKMLKQIEERYNKKLADLVGLLMEIDVEKRKKASEIRKIIEEQYKEFVEQIPSFKEAELFVNKLELVKQDLQSQHKGLFGFENDKPFSVKVLHENWIKDKGLKDFINDVGQKLKENSLLDIEQLEMSVAGCQMITDQGIKNLSIFIGTQLQNLRTLSLNFSLCTQITNQGLRDLGHIGPNLNELQDLSLSFRWCKEITDKGFKDLGNHIGSNVKHLGNLSLDFRNCDKLTEEGIKAFSIGLGGSMTKLKSLKFRFSTCPLIDDHGVEHMCHFLGPKFPQIESLSLTFALCPKITLSSIKYLHKHIRDNHIKLKNLFLDFTGCEKITDKLDLKTLVTMKRSLDFIPKLELIFV